MFIFTDNITLCCLKEGTDQKLLEFIKSSYYPAYSVVNTEELWSQLISGNLPD